jgi:hypoxanthine phosphoribosyltransferase
MRTLITESQIAARIGTLAAEISRDHAQGVHLVCVLKGAFVFLADLVRKLTCDVTLDFVAVASYGAGTRSSGQVRILKDLDTSLEDRSVVIVEDIVDSGLTVAYLQQILRARSPRSLKTACLLSKAAGRQVDVTLDYIGFDIANVFVVGYGLDGAERYRHLPNISVLEA